MQILCKKINKFCSYMWYLQVIIDRLLCIIFFNYMDEYLGKWLTF